tara:strand:+ start:594 stop:2081 length:1488 start_codon:yes stop_codon:yes gene_type:complete
MAVIAPVSEQDYIDQMVANRAAIQRATVFPDIEGRRPLSMDSGFRVPDFAFGLLSDFLPVDMADEGGDYEPAVPQFAKNLVNFMSRTGASAVGDAPMMAPEDMAMGLLDFTGAGVVAGTPARIAAKEAGDVMLGSAGGYYGGILDDVDPKFIERLKRIADGTYANEPYFPSNISDLGNLKEGKPYGDMTSTSVQEVDLSPQTIMRPEDFTDANIIFTVGDRTSTGRRLLDVDGVPLSGGGLLTDGGAYFTRGVSQQADDSVWASGDEVIDALGSRIDEFSETGDPTKLVYVGMGPKSDEYSKMPTRAALQLLPNTKISQKTVSKFNEAMRKFYPEFVGLKSGKISDQLMSNGEMRKKFLEVMESVKGGLPDIQSIRKAITEKELLGLPTGSGGLAVSDVTGPARILKRADQTTPHDTYSDAIQGKGGGIIGAGRVPMEIYAPKFISGRREIGSAPASDYRSFSMPKAFKTQRGNPEFVDRLGQYLHEAGRMGLLD